MLKKSIFTSIIITLLLILTSCKTTITNVILTNQVTTFDIETFKVEKLELKVTYSDDEIKMIKVQESMLSDEDLQKLSTLGSHIITINYEGFVISDVTITLKENAELTINVVEITADDKYYKAQSLSNKYVANCTHDSQYDYIIITVILNQDYHFSINGIEFYINEELIDASLYTIQNNKLEYKYKDPYWSDIY